MSPQAYQTWSRHPLRPALPLNRSTRTRFVAGEMVLTMATSVGGILGIVSCAPSEAEPTIRRPPNSTIPSTNPTDIRVVPSPTVVTNPTARPLDDEERAAVESFAEALRNFERRRETIDAEFQVVGTMLETYDFDDFDEIARVLRSSTSTLESVVRQQTKLLEDVQSR